MPDRSKVITQTKNDTLVQVGGWGVRMTTSPRKKVDVEKTSEVPRRGLINRVRSGYKEKELTSRTWNVRTFFKTGGLIFLL